MTSNPMTAALERKCKIMNEGSGKFCQVCYFRLSITSDCIDGSDDPSCGREVGDGASPSNLDVGLASEGAAQL